MIKLLTAVDVAVSPVYHGLRTNQDLSIVSNSSLNTKGSQILFWVIH